MISATRTSTRGLRVGLAALAFVALSGCSGGDSQSSEPAEESATSGTQSSPTTTEESASSASTTTESAGAPVDPASLLLTIDDMPTGWSVVDLGPSESKGVCSNPGFTQEHPPVSEAIVQFGEDPQLGPFVQERVQVFASADDVVSGLTELRRQADSCTTWEDDDAAYTIGAMSFPSFGDDSAAYRLVLEQGSGSTSTALLIVVQLDDRLMILTQVSDDVELAESLTTTAVARVDAG